MYTQLNVNNYNLGEQQLVDIQWTIHQLGTNPREPKPKCDSSAVYDLNINEIWFPIVKHVLHQIE